MYFTPTTPLPVFVPLPEFILRTAPLSLNAKLLYGLLLHRTQLSQQSGWTDSAGRVYVFYPIPELARDLGRSDRTVKNALRELEEADLLTKVRQGQNKANQLFLRIPEGVLSFTPRTGSSYLPDGQKAAPPDGQVLPPSKKEPQLKDFSKNKEVRTQPPRRCFGEYENVFLTDGEYESLLNEFPTRAEPYIQKLSTYMETSGHHYRNHAAVLRKWLREDAPKQQAYSYDDCADMCV